MRFDVKKRAKQARAGMMNRKILIFGLTLVLGVSAIRETWKAGAECNGEAKVKSIFGGLHHEYRWADAA